MRNISEIATLISRPTSYTIKRHVASVTHAACLDAWTDAWEPQLASATCTGLNKVDQQAAKHSTQSDRLGGLGPKALVYNNNNNTNTCLPMRFTGQETSKLPLSVGDLDPV